MPLPLFVVDAFTDRPFAGNPAAVVLLDGPAEPGWMQSVAAEMRHSETAFTHTRPDGRRGLRWYTPAAEVELCGHATLATAHALWEHGGADRGSELRFLTASGELVCRSAPEGRIEMSFPVLPSEPVEPDPAVLAALGLRRAELLRSRFDLCVLLPDAAAVLAIEPDFAVLREVPFRGICVSAPGGSDDVDFVSRFFAPAVGIDEDPVTGSAHCMLTPIWAERLGRSRLEAAQIGPRGGRVGVELAGDRVLLRGAATTVVTGQLLA